MQGKHSQQGQKDCFNGPVACAITNPAKKSESPRGRRSKNSHAAFPPARSQWITRTRPSSTLTHELNSHSLIYFIDWPGRLTLVPSAGRRRRRLSALRLLFSTLPFFDLRRNFHSQQPSAGSIASRTLSHACAYTQVGYLLFSFPFVSSFL